MPKKDQPVSSDAGQRGNRIGVLSGQLENLRAQFLDRLRRDRAELTELREAIAQAPAGTAQHVRLMRLAHGLHGISASFGYSQLGDCAADMEAAARAASTTDAVADVQRLDGLLVALCAALDAVIAQG